MLKEEDVRIIIAQLLLTVDYMSNFGIVHRDLKPENVLLRSNQEGVYEIRVADFGFAMLLNPDRSKEGQPGLSPKANLQNNDVICGTAGYIAPEVLHLKGYSNKSDIFAVGSIMYSLLTCKNLFKGKNQKEIIELNKKCDLTQLDYRLRKYSEQTRDLVR